MKNYKRTVIITTIICLIPLIVGAVLYPSLPVSMVTHWGIDGNPDGWQSKTVGAIYMPACLLLLNLAMAFVLKTDPKYKNMNSKIIALSLWVIPIVSLFCSGAIISSAYGKEARVTLIMPMLLGLLFTVIGNYLPKTSRNYTIGIRLPWTLDSDENWEKVHRMAGFLFVIGGIAMIAVGIACISVPKILFAAFIAISLVLVLVPTVYSYILYKKSK